MSQAAVSQQPGVSVGDLKAGCNPLTIPPDVKPIGISPQLVSNSSSTITSAEGRSIATHAPSLNQPNNINQLSGKNELHHNISLFILYFDLILIVFKLYCFFIKVPGINTNTMSTHAGAAHVAGPLNVKLEPNLNSIVGNTSQPNLQSQPSVVSSIHQTLVTVSSGALASSTDSFPLPTHNTPNPDTSVSISNYTYHFM